MTPPLGDPFAPTEPEWLMMAKLGIKTKTELPQIIPPLPKGDTTDMKLWREYWKQHDTAIRNVTLDGIIKAINEDIEYEDYCIKTFDTRINRTQKAILSQVVEKIESLRGEP